MHVLVTGAAGFIGSHLCEELVQRGYDVRALDCFTPYYWPALKEMNAKDLLQRGVEVKRIDLAEDSIDTMLTDIDVVVHLAAQPGISSSTRFVDYVSNNVMATHRLILAIARSKKQPGVINISTSSVYGSNAHCSESMAPAPISAYGVTKLAAEQLVLSAHREGLFQAASLRLFSVYGPRERPEKLFSRLLLALLEEKCFPLYAGSLDHLRSFTYVRDIVEGIATAIPLLPAIGGEVINMGNPHTHTTAEAISTAEAICARPLMIRHLPARAGDQQITHAIIDKAQRILGWTPQTTLRQGLTSQLEWTAEHFFPHLHPRMLRLEESVLST